MKKRLAIYLGLLAALFLWGGFIKSDSNTVIYIVRHAEKDASNPNNADPDLSAEGQARAIDLARTLRKEKIAAIFTTSYKRTEQTAIGVAKNNNLNIMHYEAKDFAGVAQNVLSQYKNQKTLIVGHSNTILEIAKAFGAKTPVETLEDDDYDLLLRVTINKSGQAKLLISRYGKPHHSTVVPLGKEL
ncbi:MAG TPA: histidine phosphatase family protein [Daejeonella sp.]|nr:histidine phosphatase family protein [Daejeonella sp.]